MMEGKKNLVSCTYHRTAFAEFEEYRFDKLIGFVNPKDYTKLYSENYELLGSEFRLDDDCRLKIERDNFDRQVKFIQELEKSIRENYGLRKLEEARMAIRRDVGNYLLVVTDDKEVYKHIPVLNDVIKTLSIYARQ